MCIRDSRKDGVWTNGDPVTAKDFEFAWSQALNPDVASDYAYFLYFIKNAEKYFNGEVTWDEVGVKVVDDYTLEVTLEQPTPYALSCSPSAPLLRSTRDSMRL